jgi:hypothetical protein
LIECPVHYADLNVRQLLQGIEPPTQSRSEALAEAAAASAAAISERLNRQTEQSSRQTEHFNEQCSGLVDRFREGTRRAYLPE